MRSTIKNMPQEIYKGFLAGVMITIGCTAYLSVSSQVTGAFLFTVALCAVCNLGLSLYTGKVCFVNKNSALQLIPCFIGNIIGCWGAGSIIRIFQPEISAAAKLLCEGKLSKSWAEILSQAVFCGILMAVAVRTYKEHTGFGRYTGIFLCIPVFILCGFEHSIADAGYFVLAYPVPPIKTVLFVVGAVIGNTIGGQFGRFPEPKEMRTITVEAKYDLHGLPKESITPVKKAQERLENEMLEYFSYDENLVDLTVNVNDGGCNVPR